MQSQSALLECLIFVALCSAVVFLPGAALLRALRVPTRGAFEGFFVSGVLGFIALCLVLVAFGWLSPALSFALPALAIASLARDFKRGALKRPELTRDDLILFASTALCLVAVSARLSYWQQTEGGYALFTYYDHLLHTGVIGELMRGVPIEHTPYVAGEPFWRYHPNTNLFGFFFVRFGGTHPMDTHLVLIHAFAWVMVAAGLGAVARRWTGSAAAGVLVCAVYFAPVLTQAHALKVQQNSPSLLALPLFLGLVWAITVDNESRSRAAFVFASICVAGLFPTKANIFLAVGPAFAIYALYALARGRRVDVVLGAAAGFVVVAVPLYLHLTHPMSRGIALEYGVFAAWLAQDRGGAMRSVIDVAVLGPILVVALWLYSLAGFWWVFLFAGVVAASRRHGRASWQVAALALALCVMLLCLVPIEEGARQYSAWNAALFIEHIVALVVVLAGVSAAFVLARALAKRLPSASARPAMVVVTSLAVQVGSVAVALGYGNPHAGLFLPGDWVHAMEALRARAPDDARVASEINIYAGTYTSGFALRPALAERVVLMGVYYESVPARLADLELAWTTEDPAVLRAALAPYGITHLVEKSDRPLKARAGLREFFHEGEITIWTLPAGEATPLSSDLQAKRAEATRRYRAALDALEGLGVDEVAREAGVEPRVLRGWIERATKRRPILD